MRVVDIIRDIMIPAVKDEVKKMAIETIEYTLYHESDDLRNANYVPGIGNDKRIRVIGPIVTIY